MALQSFFIFSVFAADKDADQKPGNPKTNPKRQRTQKKVPYDYRSDIHNTVLLLQPPEAQPRFISLPPQQTHISEKKPD
jgi:hypothetical protein